MRDLTLFLVQDPDPDVEEIIDMTEPIIVDDPSLAEDDEPSTVTGDEVLALDDSTLPPVWPIKQEKPDVPTEGVKCKENDGESSTAATTIATNESIGEQDGKFDALFPSRASSSLPAVSANFFLSYL
jgi:hypothetical protein